MKRQLTHDQQVNQFARHIERREQTAPSSAGWVDKDWDRIDEVEQEYAERLRTRGTF